MTASDHDKNFPDYFSALATDYAAYRPKYPAEIFSWLASLAPSHELVWDCACGNGQAAMGFTPHFERIIATDASQEQLDRATPHEKIEYKKALAEDSGLENNSVNLISIALALHWFATERFYNEARRVLKPKGIIAAWAYGPPSVDDPAMNSMLHDFGFNLLGPHHPPEVFQIFSEYRDLPFPFTTIVAPPFHMRAEWSLSELFGYFKSWSAHARYKQANGTDPLVELGEKLLPHWGDPKARHKIHWTLALKVGK